MVDLRPVNKLPPAKRIGKIFVIAPPELIALKVIACHQRRAQPKSGTDWRDVAELLLQFPALKQHQGAVLEALKAEGADRAVLNLWKKLVAEKIQAGDDE